MKENTEFNINKNKINTNKYIENENKEKDKNGYIKIDELMGRMKMIGKKNVKDNSKEVSYKENIYYLLTEKGKKSKKFNEKENQKLNLLIKEYNNKEKDEEKNKVNFSNNNSTKLVKNLLKINSFKLKEKNEIKIKKASKNDKLVNNERISRKEKDTNKRLFNKKGFIDTSVSFDKSHDGGRIRDNTKPRKILNIQSEKKRININTKNKKNVKNILLTRDTNNIEEDGDSIDSGNRRKKNYEEIKRKEKDNKYIKLKSKNKKFLPVKINEEININNKLITNNNYNEKGTFKVKTIINPKFNEKIIMKRNRLENNKNYSIKNYTNNNRNNNEEFNTIINDDISFSNNNTEKRKNLGFKKKIQTSNTQGNFINKFTIKKKHLYSSLNESKKDISKKNNINSSVQEKIKSFNNTDKHKSIEDIFYKTFINNNHKQYFPFNSNIKNTIEEIDIEKTENKIKDDNFKPFDLDFIFIKKLNDIKEILIKEMKLKKYKYKMKKNGYLLYKNDNQIELDFYKINNNIYNIKAMRKQGKYNNCKNIIKNIISKIR